MDHLLFDCAWSQGSRDQQTGCPGAPWILAVHQGLAGPETLSDQEVQRVLSLPSGQGHRQTRGYLVVQVSPPTPSHLAVPWGLEVPEAPSDLRDPPDQGALAPL